MAKFSDSNIEFGKQILNSVVNIQLQSEHLIEFQNRFLLTDNRVLKVCDFVTLKDYCINFKMDFGNSYLKILRDFKNVRKEILDEV